MIFILSFLKLFKMVLKNNNRPFPIDTFFSIPESVSQFNEMLARVQSPDTPETVWFWVGSGNNGKTTLIKQLINQGIIARDTRPLAYCRRNLQNVNRQEYLIGPKSVIIEANNVDIDGGECYNVEITLFDKTF